jgi:hypothetical protein
MSKIKARKRAGKRQNYVAPDDSSGARAKVSAHIVAENRGASHRRANEGVRPYVLQKVEDLIPVQPLFVGLE